MRETWHVCSYGKIGTRIRIGYGYQKVISAHLWEEGALLDYLHAGPLQPCYAMAPWVRFVTVFVAEFVV